MENCYFHMKGLIIRKDRFSTKIDTIFLQIEVLTGVGQNIL